MIHLERVNRENWRQAVFVTSDPERKCPLDEKWVTSTAFSIVQSVYEPEWESRLILDKQSSALSFMDGGKRKTLRCFAGMRSILTFRAKATEGRLCPSSSMK